VFGHTPFRGSCVPIGASFFFAFELKYNGKDSKDPTQNEFHHHTLYARRNPSLNTGLEWSANHCITSISSVEEEPK